MSGDLERVWLDAYGTPDAWHRSRRQHDRRVTELEAAPIFDAPHGSIYAQELADTREAARLRRERSPR